MLPNCMLRNGMYRLNSYHTCWLKSRLLGIPIDISRTSPPCPTLVCWHTFGLREYRLSRSLYGVVKATPCNNGPVRCNFCICSCTPQYLHSVGLTYWPEFPIILLTPVPFQHLSSLLCFGHSFPPPRHFQRSLAVSPLLHVFLTIATRQVPGFSN